MYQTPHSLPCYFYSGSRGGACDAHNKLTKFTLPQPRPRQQQPCRSQSLTLGRTPLPCTKNGRAGRQQRNGSPASERLTSSGKFVPGFVDLTLQSWRIRILRSDKELASFQRHRLCWTDQARRQKNHFETIARLFFGVKYKTKQTS